MREILFLFSLVIIRFVITFNFKFNAFFIIFVCGGMNMKKNIFKFSAHIIVRLHDSENMRLVLGRRTDVRKNRLGNSLRLSLERKFEF